MRAIPVLVALVGATWLPVAHAESLRCNGQSTQLGDSRLSVLHKCGEPLLKDAYCAPVYHVPSYQLVPPPLVGIAVPCRAVEEWLYDRGPGNLMATVRFQAGVVHSIDYGRQPR
ncbi:DUF2845 domain-containing protein [Schlegelella sp. S2-27]|uniref:DUF2845 domain-containing protein n=1 Tax=Caldimonas mangrovi TaxID=2944811 RepID=A0ABT0YKQ5_9BURK|nr:DUF2845 domain-containing protein [Caldimonas mangrovi]MCM5678989.1 DUF2845 domain-containing protein [Caldimonas mangrovi]